MPGKQVNELDVLPSFTDTSLLPVHNGTGLKKVYYRNWQII